MCTDVQGRPGELCTLTSELTVAQSKFGSNCDKLAWGMHCDIVMYA